MGEVERAEVDEEQKEDGGTKTSMRGFLNIGGPNVVGMWTTDAYVVKAVWRYFIQ